VKQESAAQPKPVPGNDLSERLAETLIFDWNSRGAREPSTLAVTLLDETLRDGLQSPSIHYPTLVEKLEGLGLMDRLGIEFANLGLPSASPRAFSEALAMCREITARPLGIRAVCAGRTVAQDVAAIIEVSQRAGVEVEASLFIGSSPIRAVAEDWNLDLLLSRSKEAIDMARRANLPVTFVTEDTTRSSPETLRALFTLAAERGATRMCLCDTVGFCTPQGVAALTRFTRETVGPQLGIDWHGHNDRGLALPNALAAISAGADRIHATALGVGERVGNTAMELLLLNLALSGSARTLDNVADYCAHFSRTLGIDVPDNHPLVGKNAFRTATGVHAAAIAKAEAKSKWLGDHVYGVVAASSVGQKQAICVGQMSGSWNVEYWLKTQGIEATESLVRVILAHAKNAEHVLSDEELLSVVKSARSGL
jgi:2-isopropylmalate synthase